MRRRIQQLARGKFEQEKPSPVFSTDKVDIKALEGKDYSGDFVITSTNRNMMRGVVYSSNPRMECLTPQFEGEEVRIRYQFHSNGLVEGDIQKGEFSIVMNQGEYNLSFVASISRLYADSSIGKIRSLNDFANLAKESFDEAYRLFYSKNFKNILRPEEQRERLLYEGLREGNPSGQKIEEFLTACHKKPKVTVSMPVTAAEFYGVTASRRETLELKKEPWGYVDIRVTSDADFLQPEKQRLTEEDFIGSVCTFDYYIKEELMHAGKNFGRLRFELPAGNLDFTVCASGAEKKEAQEKSVLRDSQECLARLMELYLDYRLKRIVTGAWARESGEILDHLSVLLPEEPIYPLMKAQALIINRQKQEAAWIMEDFKRECVHRDSPEWGYYLYLCTLVQREPSYVDRLTAEIEEIFRKNPHSSLLFWVLLFVKEEYCANSGKRLKAIEERMALERSPYFYLEAYYLIWQDPYLLTRLDEFELSVLNWAVKQNVLTRELAAQVIDILPAKKEFSKFLYRILEKCYEVSPKEEVLAAVCGYLIKSQCFGQEYHRWYALGIKEEIRLTGLYEAYLMSLDGRTVVEVPKVIQMYFQYDSRIPYQQKAVLFVNIIAAKEKEPEVYQKYQRTMEQFAMEQIEAMHINDNLAVIYGEMLKSGTLNEELGKHLSTLLFTHKFTCFIDKAAKLYVYQRELKEPFVANIMGGTAYFPAYTENYCLVVEDSCGNRFCETLDYTDEALMNPKSFVDRRQKSAATERSYMLYRMQGKSGYQDFSEEEVKYFLPLLSDEKVSEAYKEQLQPELARYYLKRAYSPLVGKYLLELDYGISTAENRRFLIEALVEEHLYEKAYALVQVYGYDYLGNVARVALCSYAIEKAGFEEDDFLSGFAESTFREGKYNDVLLIYLCKYYNGATKSMEELWKAAGEFEIDTFDLEERIITQMLYSTDYVACIDEIYDSYTAGGGRELVCMAYLSYFAHAYLVKDAVVPEQIFWQITMRYSRRAELNDACRLGLLKYLGAKKERKREQSEIADELLALYTEKNIYFAFYRQFEKKLILKYHLYDKFFVEYHAEPKGRIMLHYSFDGVHYREEELQEVYDGIYVKQFILFFGETVQYYMVESSGGEPKVTESGSISNQNVTENESSRYGKLNELLLHEALEETEALKRELKNYYGMKRVTEEVFDLL